LMSFNTIHKIALKNTGVDWLRQGWELKKNVFL
jgi:hypothetical protein